MGIEKRLVRDPGNETLLSNAMAAWIQAGGQRIEALDTAAQPIPSAVSEDYEAGLRAWDAFLKESGDEAIVKLSESASGTFFQLVEIGSTDPSEARANAAGAVRAQRIACKHMPNLYTLSNLAVYEYFNGEYAAGDRAAKRAAEDIERSKSKAVIEQLDEYKERGEKFVARVRQGAEELRESGDEELDVPIKGYGAPAGINGYEPGAGPGA